MRNASEADAAPVAKEQEARKRYAVRKEIWRLRQEDARCTRNHAGAPNPPADIPWALAFGALHCLYPHPQGESLTLP